MPHRAYIRFLVLIALSAITSACTSGAGSKVLQDFGLQERPDDYVSGSDQVLAKLPDVAKTEIQRLNTASRTGEVKYEREDELRGAYYKRVKVYEDYRPLDANYTSKKSAQESVSFVGYIEYNYQYFESPRRESRVAAQAEIATIPSGDRGSETFRYRFTSGGNWDGAKGEPVRTQ